MSTLNINVQNQSLESQSSSSPLPSTSNSEFIQNSPESSEYLSPIRPRRKSCERVITNFNRRVIAKPKKLNKKLYVTDKEIRNLYINNKLVNYKPTNLETIFEEPSPSNGKEQRQRTTSTTNAVAPTSSSSSSLKPYNFFGNRKMRRRASFTDVLNVPKSIIQTRRKRIKRLLGKNLKLEKLSMNSFLEHLKNFNCDIGQNLDTIETQSDIELSNAATNMCTFESDGELEE